MSYISECDLELLKQYVKESNSIKELQIKLGYSPNSGVSKTIKNYCQQQNISLEHFTSLSKEKIKRTENNTFCINSTASQKVLRNLYKKGNYTEYKCSICGQEPFWNGKELTLTLDHINGINTDDRLENLRWVCPNCDRQLNTFCSKNNRKERVNKAKKTYCVDCGKEISHDAQRCMECEKIRIRKVKNRPSNEELKNILLQNKGNFSKVGKLFNVSDNTIRKWCKSYNLSYYSKDYK